jgi:hypothetical protein
MLRLLRLAAGHSVDDASVAADMSAPRIRELEAGRATLGYLEGILLAKAYFLCPNCFSRHFRTAAARDAVAHEGVGTSGTHDDGDPSADLASADGDQVIDAA